MLGDPNALYELDAPTQASVLGWYAASRFPEHWRVPKRSRMLGKSVQAESQSAEQFWFGGD